MSIPMMNWMVVFGFMPPQTCQGQMANDAWLPGCKCGTGLSSSHDLAHGWAGA